MPKMQSFYKTMNANPWEHKIMVSVNFFQSEGKFHSSQNSQEKFVNPPKPILYCKSGNSFKSAQKKMCVGILTAQGLLSRHLKGSFSHSMLTMKHMLMGILNQSIFTENALLNTKQGVQLEDE